MNVDDLHQAKIINQLIHHMETMIYPTNVRETSIFNLSFYHTTLVKDTYKLRSRSCGRSFKLDAAVEGNIGLYVHRNH